MGEILTPAEIVARIDAVTAEDVQRVAAAMLGGGVHGAVIGPFRSEVRLLKAMAG
jgi:predicted Zn-dependent peptidase